MNFHQRLNAALLRSAVCIGLDPDIDKLPSGMRSPDKILAFNKDIIDATFDLVGAFKPNFAFYEAHGAEGWKILEQTVRHIRSKSGEIVVIADAKRGDIGNTANLYAQSILQELDFDCVTLSPFMGYDSIEPFIRDEDRGAFILCLTSNDGARDFQYFSSDREPLYRFIAEKVVLWNKHQNCGLVVGATHAKEMELTRRSAGSLPFLIPGVGAQGGDLESVVKINFDGQKINGFINSSRAILYASSEANFAAAAREATLDLKNQIDDILKKYKTNQHQGTKAPR